MTTAGEPPSRTGSGWGPGESTFPADLLAAPVQQRYEYFRQWRVVHPKLEQAKDELWQAIRYAGDRRVIQLFGCTGVGKTTLRLWLEKLLTAAAGAELARDPDVIPVASVITPAPDQGPFSWRDVYVQTMHALGEPQSLIARKRSGRLQFIWSGSPTCCAAWPGVNPTLNRSKRMKSLT